MFKRPRLRSLVLLLSVSLLCLQGCSGGPDDTCEGETCEDTGAELDGDGDTHVTTDPSVDTDSGDDRTDADASPDTDGSEDPDPTDADVVDDTNLADDTDVIEDADTNLADDTDVIEDTGTNTDVADVADVIEDTDILEDTDVADDTDVIGDTETDATDDIEVTDVADDTGTNEDADVADDTDVIEDTDTGPIDCRAEWEFATNDTLLAAIRARHTATHTRLIDYSGARTAMFSDIDNVDGWVTGVYTGFRLETSIIPVGGRPMNTEHTWPQSQGADNELRRSDLHHLFPTESDANGARASLRFCDVVGGVDWHDGESQRGVDASGATCFEPPDGHKGDVARALFHFSAVYGYELAASYEEVLRAWNEQDPPDDWEMNRNTAIEGYQGSRNAFVDCPELVSDIVDF